MFEPVLMFFSSIAWWEIIIFIVISISMVALLYEEYASIPIGALLFILFYHWGEVGPFIKFQSVLDAWIYISGYLIIGLIWSFFKWGKLVNYYISKYENEEDVRHSLKIYSYDKIAYWVVWWPFSLFGFLFDDVIQWFISHFKGIYRLISDKMIETAVKDKKLNKHNIQHD